jgi:predicted pyridoxine 5'-phosphate oxidase superfamily flavin-nucleotide-binding protein
MTDPATSAELWAQALSSAEQGVADLAPVLADTITTVSALGKAEGKDDVLASFAQSPIAELLATAKWSTPETKGDTATMTCTFTAGAPVGGLTVAVTVDAEDRITLVETTIIPSGPPVATPIQITDSMADAVNGALMNGAPFIVAYVDASGQPHLSLRGTVQAYSDDQLALWVRNPEGGLPAAIANQPHLALFYREPGSRTSYQFHGRARVDSRDEVRDRVFENSPERERNFDPQRLGVAVVVDIDHIEGRDATGVILMDRGEG